MNGDARGREVARFAAAGAERRTGFQDRVRSSLLNLGAGREPRACTSSFAHVVHILHIPRPLTYFSGRPGWGYLLQTQLPWSCQAIKKFCVSVAIGTSWSLAGLFVGAVSAVPKGAKSTLLHSDMFFITGPLCLIRGMRICHVTTQCSIVYVSIERGRKRYR